MAGGALAAAPSALFSWSQCMSRRTTAGSRSGREHAYFGNSRKTSGHEIRALFWGRERKKELQPFQRDLSLSAEEATTANVEVSRGATQDESNAADLSTITVSVISSISRVSAEEWDSCATDASGVEAINPFVLHDFLLSLEESKSASQEEGWLAQHLVARDGVGNVLGVVPLYLKSHSYGEYVFDHAWANAYFRYGGNYYPKLQSCVPFTPATGPRILVRAGPFREQVFDGLAKAMQQLTHQMKASSINVTFPRENEWERMGKLGYLQRIGMQYHWENRNYKSFDDFLMDLKQGKRKNIRQERKKIQVQNLKMKRLRGDDIKPYHWDAFYDFYRNTTDNKWGQAYLSREFFHMMGSRMGDKVLLVVAEDGGELVGGALNLIGGDTLYGRNWGCAPRVYYPSLHFEACYYQAIEAAIEWGLKRVEAGAQGEHKIQRGYIPKATYSCHYIADPDFRRAIESFLNQETLQMRLALELLEETSPFKEGILGTSDG
ncbi:uncharacterized protein MPTK1_3g02300 [Marchantia polymorpha subsp. ruderalis]|uniref:Uncharacterized protein n=2 Tax=Marchantia polymorpha TaxID=3197 RepID=A0AAF6AWN4_MARPO|nr:hypothetical protein MARPO_0007s0219 [Marchantia polymorpha]BBN04168.1 hypothetical protein Mp_3g02300 [Marchantia polymorpha subsp. ruderalis]|eukprot:PTQ47855.1 hypothetical protein MARPO_0007s0219 [Marchantia polymorpha]